MEFKLLVDGHVHFHQCFSWDTFLDAAAANFAAARRALGLANESPGCLMFTENAGVNYYRTVSEQPWLARSLGWRVDKCDDGCSVLFSRGRNETMMVLAGRQIVTAERLEVLALGCVHEFPDGRPIGDVVRAVADHGAIAVVPWGLGKWLGRRGRILRRLIETSGDIPLSLGDNGGRARLLPRPALFAWAERRNLTVLGGSDPLPLPSHATRAGSYGFVLDGCLDPSRPGSGITAQIRTLRRSPPPFGALSSLPVAIRSQVGFRWRQRRIAAAGHRAPVVHGASAFWHDG